jgi:hypothetical protein
LPFTTSGAIVMVSPLLMSPSCVRQTSFRCSRRRRRLIVERVVEDLAVGERAPRFTTSQHATPVSAASGFGSYFHFAGAPGFVRSSA